MLIAGTIRELPPRFHPTRTSGKSLMRIVVAEILGQEKLAPRQFDQSVIRIGRDPARCDLLFEQGKYPMVSRLHAEIHLQSERCLLIDAGSTQGTFLNGQRIVAPAELQPGFRVQFGTKGPTIVVDSIENPAPVVASTGSSPKQEFETRVDFSHFPDTPVRPETTFKPVPQSKRPDAIPYVVFESGGSTTPEGRTSLNKNATLLGRDPAADISVDAAAAVVSRRHAEIQKSNGNFQVVDLNSFNGTLLNGQRINQPTPLQDGDRIQLGLGGPVFRFVDPASFDEQEQSQPLPDQLYEPSLPAPVPVAAPDAFDGQRTVVIRSPRQAVVSRQPGIGSDAQLLTHCSFDRKARLSVGRSPDNDIRVDGLLISNHHAVFSREANGVFVEDSRSTNGVYINGVRISGRRPVQSNDVIQIGSFLIQADPMSGVSVFDTRSKIRIDAIDITRVTRHRSGRGSIVLLDDVDLTIQPNEFIGLIGPSGAGKSTLMNALNGMSPTTNGRVLINNLDLYQHIDSLKQSIGYVPQDDIMHRDLTVYRTLYYVARLRLSRDVPKREIDQIIGQVLDVTGLTEKRDVTVSQLSGGQRKRVSIAVELITKPSVLFLDEPTSGLDPATEDKIMKLFRQIAESGHTVVLTTHAMENISLFDKIVVLMRGKLIFYGTPAEGIEFVGVSNFKDFYDKLEEPIEVQMSRMLPLSAKATKAQKRAYEENRNQIADAVAEEWRRNFHNTTIYQRNIVEPLSGLERGIRAVPMTNRRTGLIDSVRQWGTLARRYLEILAADKTNLLILLGQAPLIALMTYLVVGARDPRDFPYFVLALVAIWFGASVAAREIVKERPVYKRERMVNLGLLPYIGSKIFVLSLIVSTQCILLFFTLKILHFSGLMSLPGLFAGLPQLLVMVLTGVVGVALGLFVSGLVKTSEMATSMVPLILIPQILFCGLVGVPQGFAKVVGAVMPATWSFDQMKRLSALDTLKPEGSSDGRGLYKRIEESNDRSLATARSEVDDYRTNAEEKLKVYEREMNQYLASRSAGNLTTAPPTPPVLDLPPTIPDAEKLSEDLSGYVSFKHPWGNTAVNPLILLVMLFAFIMMTIISLRAKDTNHY